MDLIVFNYVFLWIRKQTMINNCTFLCTNIYIYIYIYIYYIYMTFSHSVTVVSGSADL